jgi:hypothetical protein
MNIVAAAARLEAHSFLIEGEGRINMAWCKDFNIKRIAIG